MAAARLAVKPFRQRFCQAGTCRAQFFLCAACDHGQRYCSPACRSGARTLQRRAARQRHQRSLAGRLDHRDRQRAYRLRQAAAARALFLPSTAAALSANLPLANLPSENSVTDHGSQARLTSSTVPLLVALRWPAVVHRSLSARGELLCARCGRVGRWLNPFYAPSG